MEYEYGKKTPPPTYFFPHKYTPIQWEHTYTNSTHTYTLTDTPTQALRLKIFVTGRKMSMRIQPEISSSTFFKNGGRPTFGPRTHGPTHGRNDVFFGQKYVTKILRLIDCAPPPNDSEKKNFQSVSSNALKSSSQVIYMIEHNFPNYCKFGYDIRIQTLKICMLIIFNSWRSIFCHVISVTH